MKKFMYLMFGSVVAMSLMSGCAIVATNPPPPTDEATNKPVVKQAPKRDRKQRQPAKMHQAPTDKKCPNAPKFRDGEDKPAQLIIYHVIITPDLIREMNNKDSEVGMLHPKRIQPKHHRMKSTENADHRKQRSRTAPNRALHMNGENNTVNVEKNVNVNVPPPPPAPPAK